MNYYYAAKKRGGGKKSAPRKVAAKALKGTKAAAPRKAGVATIYDAIEKLMAGGKLKRPEAFRCVFRPKPNTCSD